MNGLDNINKYRILSRNLVTFKEESCFHVDAEIFSVKVKITI